LQEELDDRAFFLPHDTMNEGLPAADSNFTLSGISTDLLIAELSARKQEDDIRPACGSGPKGAYNTPLHVAALFLILVLSVLGSLTLSLQGYLD
jgi:hypothetical protein